MARGNPMYREAFFWDRLRDGRPIIVPGDGSRLMHFVYVYDLVYCAVRSLSEPASVGQAFNVGDPAPVTQEQAVEAFALAAGRTANIVHVPREAALAAGGSPIWAEVILCVLLRLAAHHHADRQGPAVTGLHASRVRDGVTPDLRVVVGP